MATTLLYFERLYELLTYRTHYVYHNFLCLILNNSRSIGLEKIILKMFKLKAESSRKKIILENKTVFRTFFLTEFEEGL